MDRFIPVNEPLLAGNEKKYVCECIETGWISSEGPFVEQFEQQLAKRLRRAHGIAVTNGTAAIDVAVEALGISEGDEVIVPAFTIISCILQIVRVGAKPVLVDCDPQTWNMDTSQIEEKISDRTVAIMAVHIYGLPVDLDPIIDLCSRYNLKLIEDAAEVIGQTYKGKPCGSFGDVSTVSFYPNKHITTGEGGMVLTNSADLARRCKELRNLCFIPEKRFKHYDLGWNLRMTNLQAAIGLAQLERLDEFVAKKRDMGSFYHTTLQDLQGINLPLEKNSFAENIYWVFGIVLDSNKPSAEHVMFELKKLGIGTRPFFYPMHLQPVLKDRGFFTGEKYPVAEVLAEKGFYIPSGLSLSLSDMEKVTFCLKKVIRD